MQQQLTTILKRERHLVEQMRSHDKKAMGQLYGEYVPASPELDDLVLQQSIEDIGEARANVNRTSMKRLAEIAKSTHWLFTRGVAVNGLVNSLRELTLQMPESGARSALLSTLAEILIEV